MLIKKLPLLTGKPLNESPKIFLNEDSLKYKEGISRSKPILPGVGISLPTPA
ncbi:hypothetical protein ASZ90_004672 [hydrocarbon metagenome]|uniref:Uncharacterized protein n=1 Tax=hydrocarbon metagenome TaxID=938273 RepID=A0A0W8FX69_9ZZZZ